MRSIQLERLVTTKSCHTETVLKRESRENPLTRTPSGSGSARGYGQIVSSIIPLNISQNMGGVCWEPRAGSSDPFLPCPDCLWLLRSSNIQFYSDEIIRLTAAHKRKKQQGMSLFAEFQLLPLSPKENDEV